MIQQATQITPAGIPGHYRTTSTERQLVSLILSRRHSGDSGLLAGSGR